MAFLFGTIEAEPRINVARASGSRIANFTLITSEKWTDKKTGQEKTRLERHKIAVFHEHLIETLIPKLKPLTKIFVEGTLENRSWLDENKVPRTSVDVVVRPGRGQLILAEE